MLKLTMLTPKLTVKSFNPKYFQRTLQRFQLLSAEGAREKTVEEEEEPS